MKYSPYSFSKISTHSWCNRKFKYAVIDKVPKEESDKTALLKGGAVHSILENYPDKSNHKLAPKYQHIFNNFLNSELGQKYLLKESVKEYKFALDKNLEPQEYNNSALLRGFIDAIIIVDDILHILDWKTGKFKDQRFQDFNQLIIYGIYFFQKYPQINKIKLSYVYVEHNLENELIIYRKYLQNYINDLLNKIRTIENDTEFKKMPNRFCYNCEYKNHCDNDK